MLSPNRPSVLAVTSEVPWPLDSGGHLRTYHLLKSLSRRYHVAVIATSAPDRIADSTAALREAGITATLVPLPRATRPSMAWSVLRAAASRRPYVMYRRHDRPDIRSAVRRQVQAIRPDVLYLDHLDSFVYAAEAGSAAIVGDMHNVYSLLARRASESHDSWLVRFYLARESRLLERAESRAAQLADLLMTVSNIEQRYFQMVTDRPVEVVPNGVDTRRYSVIPVSRRSNRFTVLYLGAMSWRPNVDAAQFLAKQVLPSLQARIPDARLQIVGRDPSADVRSLADAPGVEVKGSVPDVMPYLAAAQVLAVPLEVGGGTRLKILEAFAAGLPVVSTPVGCEGIECRPDAHLVVASRSEFASAIAALGTHVGEAESMAKRARELVTVRYDWSVVGRMAADLIESTIVPRLPRT